MSNTKRERVSAEEFCKAWQSAHSIDAVAAKFGRTVRDVSQSASRYRSFGIKLKVFTRARARLDVAGINAAISEKVQP